MGSRHKGSTSFSPPPTAETLKRASWADVHERDPRPLPLTHDRARDRAHRFAQVSLAMPVMHMEMCAHQFLPVCPVLEEISISFLKWEAGLAIELISPLN